MLPLCSPIMPLPVLTQEALRDRLAALERIGKVGLYWLLLSLVPPLVVVISVVTLAPGGPAPTWFFVAGPLSFGPLLSTIVWMSVRMSRQRLECPACHCRLEGFPRLSEVIATRRCVNCQNVIVGPEGELVQLTEAIQPGETPDFRQFQQLLLLGRTGAVWWISGILYTVIARLLVDHYRPWLSIQLGELVVPFVLPIASTPGLVLLGWGLLRGVKRIEQRDHKCPACQEPVHEGTLQSTGCCSGCGAVLQPERVVVTADAPVDGSLTLSEFCDQSKTSGPNAWMILFGYVSMFSGMLLAAWLGPWLFYGSCGIVLLMIIAETRKCQRISQAVMCPACSRSLFQNRWRAISTRRCGYCGSKVIRDDQSTSSQLDG